MCEVLGRGEGEGVDEGARGRHCSVVAAPEHHRHQRQRQRYEELLGDVVTAWGTPIENTRLLTMKWILKKYICNIISIARILRSTYIWSFQKRNRTCIWT